MSDPELTPQIRPTALDDMADIEARLRRLQSERQELEKELKAAEAERAKNPMITAAEASDINSKEARLATDT